MEKYIHEGSLKTPEIIFDLNSGFLNIKGRSIPENSFEFYKPLTEALLQYSTAAKPVTIVNVKLDYFNTPSSKCILEIFKKLEHIYKKGNAVTINWNYEADDDDMLEAGMDYQEILEVPLTMVPF